MPKNVIINFALNLARGKTSLNIYAKFLLLIPAMSFVISCRDSSESKMIRIISGLNQKDYNSRNPFCPEAKVAQCDSLLKLPGRENDFYLLNTKAKLLLETGDENTGCCHLRKDGEGDR
ncbi:hypothetical protein ACRQ5D_24650 [Mucilaginibacter sp. P25]|uniref:hypothetical protein n=1 Tax=Mucilaginibacter sp. P25 TaxID=3423945 RepID=UPI003D7A4A94